jgi:1-acyl-sn-glycerol-3-phosphate acyltransferase
MIESYPIRLLRSIWIWTACTALVLFWLPVLGIVRLLDHDPLLLATARWFRRLGRVLAKVNPWRIYISGLQNLQPGQVYVIVSNHQSLGDIPLISHLPIDTKWLAKAELFRIPVVGWMMRMAGDVPVERTDRRKAAQALLHCARYLRQGVSVMFFPEGTRSPDGQVLPFNDGPFQLAIREQVPVLPLVVEGSGKALPRNSFLFGGVQDIYLRVLLPVPVQGRNVKDTGVLRDQVRQQIVDELEHIARS